MPINGLQRRLQECGRIRIGHQVKTDSGKTRPARLETFRLTSPDKQRIESAATLYGGTVEPWDAPAGAQWQVITEADKLPVIVPPASMAFSQWLELWSGGGCLRRCDGDTEQLTDTPCMCAIEGGERQCSPHTRLSLLLRDLPGLGVWRLDTQGYYAATELEFVARYVDRANSLVDAVLRLDQRIIKRPNQPTKRFCVPVLEPPGTPGEMFSGGVKALQHNGTDDYSIEGDSVVEIRQQQHDVALSQPQAADQNPEERRSSGPGRGKDAATTRTLPASHALSEPPGAPITQQQLDALHELLPLHGLGDKETGLAWLSEVVEHDVPHSKTLTTDEAAKAIALLDEEPPQ